MKKLIITTAVMLMAVLVSSQANAELLSLSSNFPNGGPLFNFDPELTNQDVLSVGNVPTGRDDGLNDLAIFVGFQSQAGVVTFNELTTGTATVNPNGNTGSYEFDAVNVGGVDIGGTIDFSLIDTSSAPTSSGFSSANLVYQLSLDAQNALDPTADLPNGSLLSFVGFDFDAQGAQTTFATDVNGDPFNIGAPITGFGGQPSDAELSNGGTRVLSFDGSFGATAAGGNGFAASENDEFDTFASFTGDNLPLRFNDISEVEIDAPSLRGLGAFSEFGTENSTNLTSGVFAFSSAAATTNIPEPSALMMASMGLGMVAFRRRRKQQA